MFLQYRQTPLKLLPRPPTWPQSLPSWPQDAPKLAPRPPSWPPRLPKLAPRSPKLASKTAQVGLKIPNFGPNSSNLAPRTSNLVPRAPKLASGPPFLMPKASQMDLQKLQNRQNLVKFYKNYLQLRRLHCHLHSPSHSLHPRPGHPQSPYPRGRRCVAVGVFDIYMWHACPGSSKTPCGRRSSGEVEKEKEEL